MRAKEFANFNFDIEPYEGWTGEGVVVHAYDGKDEIGHVIFEPTEDDVTQWYAVDVEVEEPYRRIGIATKMYDMAKQAAKSAGAIIVKSHTQTDAGRGLWRDKNVWEQQVNEYKEYPTREYEGVTFTMKEKDGQLIVKPLNDYGISMGHVIFNMDGKILDPQDLVIADKYQGQGIARVMYDYIKSLGFTIERSWDQTEAGKGFWNKHRGEDVRVWEDESQTYSSKQVLQYIKGIHKDGWIPAADKMVTRHKRWKLTQVPVASLHIPDPESDEDYNDPYGRVHDTDLHHVDRLSQAIIQQNPIVVDREGYVLDGNHRALAALKAGLKTIPAYVPVEEQLEDVRVWEVTNPDIHNNQFKHEQEIGDYLYTAKADNNSGYGNQLIIKVYDGKKEIGFVEFVEEPDDKVLISGNTWVHKNYREQGIATNMYAYAKMLGNDIIPSWDQTDQGERMWRSWNQSGQSKHILPKGQKGFRELDEQINKVKVYHGNQGGIHRELITPMWWTENKQDAISYATQGGADGWVYSATLSCKNPYVIKSGDETNTVLEKWKQLQKQGYDSIHDESVGDWIPFYSKDIHLVGKPEYQDSEELSETVLDEYSETAPSIRTALSKKGYKFLGAGVDQSAYIEPGTGHVLKIFGTDMTDKFSPDHKMFFKWYQFCSKHQDNPYLPRFFGHESFMWPDKRYPDDQHRYLMIRTEPLKSSGVLGRRLANIVRNFDDYSFKEVINYQKQESYFWPDIAKQMGGEENLIKFLQTCYKLKQMGDRNRWLWDLHEGNIMMRADGTPIINDPWVI